MTHPYGNDLKRRSGKQKLATWPERVFSRRLFVDTKLVVSDALVVFLFHGRSPSGCYTHWGQGTASSVQVDSVAIAFSFGLMWGDRRQCRVRETRQAKSFATHGKRDACSIILGEIEEGDARAWSAARCANMAQSARDDLR
jgi:hypothetical protein